MEDRPAQRGAKTSPFVELRLGPSPDDRVGSRAQPELLVRGPGRVEIELSGEAAQRVVAHILKILGGGEPC